MFLKLLGDLVPYFVIQPLTAKLMARKTILSLVI